MAIKVNKKGKFIVLYGANNIGKTTQTEILVTKLQNTGKKVKRIKYPVYDLEPTGPILDKFLRHGLQMSELEAQEIFVQNRRDFEPELLAVLDRGVWVVGEDYKGTGICWGATHGVSLEKMLTMNNELYSEDLAILLDAEYRFDQSIERGHHNEDGGVWERGRDMHRRVGKILGWEVVNANQPIDKVADDVWRIVEKQLLM